MIVLGSVSSRTDVRVAAITAGLLQKIHRITNAAQRAEQARVQERARHEAALRQDRLAIRRCQEWILPLARSGLRNLLALSARSDIIEMINAARRLSPGTVDLDFYEGVRMSGGAWDYGSKTWRDGQGESCSCDAERVARITFSTDAVTFSSGVNFGADTNWSCELKHDSLSSTQECFLKRVVSAVECGSLNGRIGLDPNQTEDEWDPDALLARVLAECAKRKNREYYLDRALKNFRP